MTRRSQPPTAGQLWLGGGVLSWVLYGAVFMTTTDVGLGLAAVSAFANAAPLVGVAAVTHVAVRAKVLGLGPWRQALAHALLAPAFALTWYALVTVLLGFFEGLAGRGFAPIGFSGPAATWQLFQGLVLYGLVAAICYALRGGREAAPVTLVGGPATRLARYLVRDGEGLRPINVARIVSITGAQDYAEVTTDTGQHLVRMSLAEFERVLDPERFVRVHRSAIINLDRLRLAEPAGGGRMIAWMEDGSRLPVSRPGAIALRERVA